MDIIFITSDHAGYDLKEAILAWLKEEYGAIYEIRDLGPYKRIPSDDYPDYAQLAAKRVVAENAKGIFICGSGIGMSIAANKVKGIRAALCLSVEMAKAGKIDSDINGLCLGQNYFSIELAKDIIKAWLETSASNEDRHVRRRNKVNNMG